jgi:hypothetical protein
VACFTEQERQPNGEIASGAVVLLTNRRCPWRCVYCDLWQNTLPVPVPAGAIPAQIDWALDRLQPSLGAGAWIKLYNAGSFFDPGAIAPEDYPAIAARVRGFRRVIVECHPALISQEAARFRDLLAPARLEVALGLETVHEPVLAKLNKGMTLAQFARATDWLRRHGIALRAFTLLQPPFLSGAQAALRWSKRALEFAFDCGAGVVIIIPTRGGTQPMRALARQGHFIPPTLATLEAAQEQGCRLERGRVFADLWNLEQFSACPHCFPARAARLRELNLRQVAAPRVACQFCGISPSGKEPLLPLK